MTWTEKSIFEHKVLLEPKKLVGEYEFYLDPVSVKIKVRIYQCLKPNVLSDPYYFSTSHYIHTPEQIGPYTTSNPWASDSESALHRAVESLASYYRTAIEKGHEPKESWFVRNDYF